VPFPPREVWYFGLQYTDEKGETAWLNLDKKLKKQDIKKEPTLQFRSDTVARSWEDFSAEQSSRSASFNSSWQAFSSGRVLHREKLMGL
jgi:hypothetical protein